MRLAPDGTVALSVDDIVAAASCRWRLLCRVDRLLRGESEPPHALKTHVAHLTERYCSSVLERYYAALGACAPDNPHGVLDVEGQAWSTPVRLTDAGREAIVVHGERLSTGAVWGVVPLTVRTGAGLELQVPRFSSHVHRETRLEVGGLAWLLRERLDARVPLAPHAYVLLATGRVIEVEVRAAIEEFHTLRLRVEDDVAARAEASAQASWSATACVCGRCADCEAAIAHHDDVLAVPGIGLALRTELMRVGITSRAALVATSPAWVEPRVLERARLQCEQAARPAGPFGQSVAWRLRADHPQLLGLPAPAPGDVYIDFENDSMWGWTPQDHTGLVYLAGLLVRDDEGPLPEGDGVWVATSGAVGEEATPQPTWLTPPAAPLGTGDLARATGWRYVAWWAHCRSEEAACVSGLTRWIEQRRHRYPLMHVYHYSRQDPMMLERMARRAGIPSPRVEALTGRSGPFVDLFAPVQSALLTGQSGSSLKDLEPLYMGRWRRGGLRSGAESVVLYDQARIASEVDTWALTRPPEGARSREERPAAARAVLERLASYNEYDCVSAMLLHRWLLLHRRDAAAC